MNDYLDHLNISQRKAVEHISGPLMVIAGAGSGKTRVLTYRIVHLLKNGVDPFNILSLTFTNKAAKEMKERIEKIIGLDAKNIWMGTFHSVFAKILRYEADKLGYPSNFTIYDTDDSKALLPVKYCAPLFSNSLFASKGTILSTPTSLSSSKVKPVTFLPEIRKYSSLASKIPQ